MQAFTTQWQDLELDFSFTLPIFSAQKAAIFLCATPSNYERLLDLELFRDLLLSFNLRADLFGVKMAQIASINALDKGLIDAGELRLSLELLESISPNNVYKGLQGKENKLSRDLSSAFLGEKEELISRAKEHLGLLPENLARDFKELIAKLEAADFKLMVTGILNAGKSSFINALLGDELLGTAAVPQTASLCVIESKGSLRVKFYSKEDFGLIEGMEDEATRSLLASLSADDLALLGKEIEIEEKDIKRFTTALYKESLMVQELHLARDLELLRGNVKLIDSPGLDDVVFLREIISQRAARSADFILHLTQAAQSLTQKDLDFLASLDKGKKIALVLSKIDLIDEGELFELTNYARARLRELLGREIEVFAISSVSKKGFARLLSYLKSSLYEDKSAALIASFKANAQRIFQDFAQQLKEDLERLGGFFKEEIDTSELEEQRQGLLAWEASYKEPNCQQLELLLQRLCERLIDELSYKKKPQELIGMLDRAVCDALDEVLGEVFYELCTWHKGLDLGFLRERIKSLPADALQSSINKSFMSISGKKDLLKLQPLLLAAFKQDCLDFNLPKRLRDLGLEDLILGALRAKRDEELSKLDSQIASLKQDEARDMLKASLRAKQELLAKVEGISW